MASTEQRFSPFGFSNSHSSHHSFENLGRAVDPAPDSAPIPLREQLYPEHTVNGNHDLTRLETVKEQTSHGAASSTALRSQPSAVQRASKIRSALGLHHQAPLDEEHDKHPYSDLLWPRIRLALREPLCEFWGVFVMVMFGDGSVAQVLLSAGETTAPGMNGYGNYQSISWGWGLGVMLGIYVAGDSGAFLNPAITLAFCVYRGLPFRRFPMYLLAQFLGGFAGSGVVYANYISAIDNYAGHGVRTVPPEKTATAQIFCTYPASFVPKASQFFSEFIASTLLIFVIFALKDESNNGAAVGAGNFFPLSLFFLIFGLGACFGWETGYAINLARDFGPRLMSYCVGYGPEVWSAGDYYFWIPIVCSFLGCLFGGFLYDFFIYTGPESPVNSPYLGLPYLLKPWYFISRRQSERGTNEPVPDEEVPKGPSD